MREQESKKIKQMIEALPPQGLRTVLELGSSVREQREIWQRHIHQNIHAPLLERGVRIVTTDIKEGDGIEIAGDVFDKEIEGRLAGVDADLILCCNIMEHVPDRAEFARVCDSILSHGRHILVTVPFSYPLHLDPIDTMYRPRPDEIAGLFRGYQIIDSCIIDTGTFYDDIRKRKISLAGQFARTVIRGVYPWRGLERAMARIHRWFWLCRPYKHSVVLLKKPEANVA